MVYFSELRGMPVYDSNKKKLGRLSDIVFVTGDEYAEVTHLIYADENRYCRKIRFSSVDEFKEEKGIGGARIGIKLNQSTDKITSFFVGGEDLLVGDVIDKQVVDVNGVKIVRVNDVLLGKIGDRFCITAVAVGKKSFLNRLGMSFILPFLPFKVKEHIIPWGSVESLEPKLHDIHLKVQKDRVANLHPEDIADVMEDMSHKERVLIFKTLETDVAAHTLIGAEPQITRSMMKSLKINRIRDLLEDIQPDEAADILSLMDPSEVKTILGCMRTNKANEIRRILEYPQDSAGAIMDTSFIAVPSAYTAQQAIDHLRRIGPPSNKIYQIYVVDEDNHLLGLLSIRSLLTAPPEERVSDFMRKDIIHVKLKTTKEDIAKTMARYNLFVLPVVDVDNVIKGIVTADDVLTEIMPEEWRRDRFRPLRIKRKKNGRT